MIFALGEPRLRRVRCVSRLWLDAKFAEAIRQTIAIPGRSHAEAPSAEAAKGTSVTTSEVRFSLRARVHVPKCWLCTPETFCTTERGSAQRNAGRVKNRNRDEPKGDPRDATKLSDSCTRNPSRHDEVMLIFVFVKGRITLVNFDKPVVFITPDGNRVVRIYL